MQSEFSFYGIDYQKGEKSLAYEQLELDENQLAEIILCGSNFVKQSLIDLNISSDKIKVVPYGYTNSNSIQVEPKSLGKQLSLLFVGNGGIRKGLRYLFEAASTLPNVKFTIAGTLEKEITLQDIPKNVRLLRSEEHTSDSSHIQKSRMPSSAWKKKKTAVLSRVAAGVYQCGPQGQPQLGGRQAIDGWVWTANPQPTEPDPDCLWLA